MLSIEYIGQNVNPIGRKNKKENEPILDGLLLEAEFDATLLFDPTLKYLSNVWVQYQREKDLLSIEIAVNPPNCSYAMEEIWRELTWTRRNDISNALGGNFHTGSFKELSQIGSINFEWFNNPEIFLYMYISNNTIVRTIENQCRESDKIFESVWSKTLIFSEGLKSAPKPERHHQYSRKVFISHSSKDKLFARKLRLRLIKEGFQAWLDEEEVLVGHDFIGKLESSLNSSDFVIIVLTPNFTSGPWAKEEYRQALTRQISENRTILLPVLKHKCEIPEFLKSKHYANFQSNFEVGFKALSDSIRKHPIEGEKEV